MEIDRETIIEAAAAALPVALMIAAFAYIGSTFIDAEGTLTAAGGQAMIGTMVVFVFVMYGIGVYLSRIRPDEGGGNPNGS